MTLHMSPMDDTFVSGSLDRTLRLWDLRSPNCQVNKSYFPYTCVILVENSFLPLYLFINL